MILLYIINYEINDEKMVYISRNENEIVIIPRHQQSFSRQFSLKIINNLTNELVSYPNLISTSKNELFYCFEINTKGLESGEYTYYVFDVNKNILVDFGLMRIDWEESVNVEYNKNENIVVYNG